MASVFQERVMRKLVKDQIPSALASTKWNNSIYPAK
jgi:hypothetical protein